VPVCVSARKPEKRRGRPTGPEVDVTVDPDAVSDEVIDRLIVEFAEALADRDAAEYHTSS
jgi:hypothetical protein